MNKPRSLTYLNQTLSAIAFSTVLFNSNVIFSLLSELRGGHHNLQAVSALQAVTQSSIQREFLEVNGLSANPGALTYGFEVIAPKISKKALKSFGFTAGGVYTFSSVYQSLNKKNSTKKLSKSVARGSIIYIIQIGKENKIPNAKTYETQFRSLERLISENNKLAGKCNNPQECCIEEMRENLKKIGENDRQIDNLYRILSSNRYIGHLVQQYMKFIDRGEYNILTARISRFLKDRNRKNCK